MKTGKGKSMESKEKGACSGKIWMAVFTGNSGLTHYSYCLTKALSAAGCDITLLTNRNYELDFLHAEFPVVKVFGRSRAYPLHIRDYWRLFRRQEPDLVHYQAPLKFPLLELLLLKLQKRRGAVLVYTAHDWIPHKQRPWHKRLYRSYYRLFDRIIVHSQTGKNFMGEHMGVDPGKLAVIPQGYYDFFNFDQKLTGREARSRLGLDDDRYWFLFFGHIAPYKGLDMAIEALARTIKNSTSGGDEVEGRRLGLLVAGEPDSSGMQIYEDRIRELGLGQEVSLHTGHIPVKEVQLYLKAADALVLPYRESSTSAVVHLAMSFDKLVITSDVGALAETVRKGSAGLVFPSGDTEALAAAMMKLANDQETRRRLEQDRAKAERMYSWDNIATETIEVYGSAAKSAMIRKMPGRSGQ